MKNSVYLIFTCLLLTSCQDDDAIIITLPEEKRCNLEIYVYECEDLFCQDKTTLNQYSVSIFSTLEDALENTNQTVTGITNVNGMVSFSSLPCQNVYIKITTEIYGTYIKRESLSPNASLNFHDVRFVNGYIYNNNDATTLRQKHISFENPIVGQQSSYRYHYEENTQAKFSISQYTGNILNVRIIGQIDNNSFIVEEKFDTLYQSFHYPQVDKVTNIWRFEHDSLYVESYQGDFIGSFVWGMSGYDPHRMSRFSVGLSRPEFNELDMNAPYSLQNFDFFPNDRWGSGHALDYTLLGNLYDMLIVDFDLNSGVDGYDRFNIFSKADGVVRNIHFFPSVHNIRGFDLVKE